ncbi:helix-turn-helix domain-containing protein [Lysinibacillus sp. RSDA_15]|uniref:helix-turn-helix domain-containing protein n=1 Tax=Lysinibacillus sp. RSDA_15 TaxID=3391421 RepID=UPI003A4D5223
MKQFLSVNEVAELLSVNPMTIYKWCKSGKLPHYTIGGSVIRFDTEQLAKHIEGANMK